MAKRITVVNFKPLVPPKAIALAYERQLRTLISGMIKDYLSILKLYKNKRHQVTGDASDNSWLTTDVQKRFAALGSEWLDRFQEYAKDKSPEFIKKILRQTDVQLKSTLKDYLADEHFALVSNNVPTPLRQVMKAHIAENVSLITSIPQQYATRVQGAVYRAITGAGSLNDLVRELKKSGDMTYRRATLIAGDQTRKAFTTIAVKRMESVGVTKYKWIHTGAGKTHRPYHKHKWDGFSGLKDGHPNGLNGFIFDMEHLPIIDERTGERGLPAQLPFCHCIMQPVILLDGEVAKL